MNILVTGANGQLGREMRIASAGGADHYLFSDVTEVPGLETLALDITNPDAVSLLVEAEKIDVIVNCAAYTDVDKAESDVAMAQLLNSQAPAYLAAAAAKRGATLIHISTDYVFQGDRPQPCREDWEPCPNGVYGATKLAGEDAVRKSGCRWLIFRTAWLYSPFGKNFVRTMRTLTAEKDSLRVVFDQVGTPTYAADLAALLVHIIRSGQLHKTGLYHYSDEGAISWFDFARAIRDLCGHSCTVEPCLSFEYPSKVRRPHYSVLDKTKVKKTFGVQIPYWLDSLRDCLRRMD